MHAMLCVWRPESVLSFYHKGPGNALRIPGFVTSVFTPKPSCHAINKVFLLF